MYILLLIFCTIVTKVRVGCADSDGDVDCGNKAQSPLPNNRSLTHSASSGPRPIPPDQLKCNILKGKHFNFNTLKAFFVKCLKKVGQRFNMNKRNLCIEQRKF